MSIVAQCKCGKTIKVKDEYAGRKGKCPACGELVLIPNAAAASRPAAPSKPAAGAARPAAKPARPAPPPASAAWDGPDLDALGELEATGTALPDVPVATPVRAAPSAPPKNETRQKACPACGSVISAFARVCEHCGAQVAGGNVGAMNYAKPNRYQSNYNPADENMGVVDILLIVFCGLIGLIVAIVYTAQGKPKGKKMLILFAVLFAIGLIFNLIMAAIAASQ